MRIYLDACSLNRPLDDQSQKRVRLEAEAVTLFMQMARAGQHDWVVSEVLEDELARIRDEDRRLCVTGLLKYAMQRVLLDDTLRQSAQNHVIQGLGAMDALHLAAAEASRCDILLTMDDLFFRKAARLQPPVRVRVLNPVRRIAEMLENE